jgi:hypothetical protein
MLIAYTKWAVKKKWAFGGRVREGFRSSLLQKQLLYESKNIILNFISNSSKKRKAFFFAALRFCRIL